MDGSKNITTQQKLNNFVANARMRIKKSITKYLALKVARIILVIFSLVPLFSVAKDPGSFTITDPDIEMTRKGYIVVNGSFRPIVANNTFEWICLAIARATAFAMYPDIFIMFASKCRATLAFLSTTPVGMFLFRDMHDVHAYCGRFVAYMIVIHTIFHLIRWGIAGNLNLLFKSAAGITGFIVVYFTPFIIAMMVSDTLRSKIRFEIRKGLHYLFYIFAIALVWHVPTSALPWGGYIKYVMLISIIWYTLDAMYVQLFMTERVSSPVFSVSPNGLQLSAKVSDSFQRRLLNGGYAYVCLPWIDKNQWHAFSLYEYPAEENTTCVFMARAGDWTTAVHKALERSTSRPVWFCGPFPSPYNNADLYDNQILIASGVGITPALSALHSLKNSRRVNIIWMVRCNHMLNFFLKYMQPDDEGWVLIYYTGKDPIDSRFEKLNTNIRIIKRRPNLELVMMNIIYGIETKSGLPERAVKSSEDNMIESLKAKISELDETGISTTKKVIELMKYAEKYGYELEPLIGEVDGSNDTNVPENIGDNGPIFDNAGDLSEHNKVDSRPEVRQTLSMHDLLTNVEEKKINKENEKSQRFNEKSQRFNEKSQRFNDQSQDPRRPSYDVYNPVPQDPRRPSYKYGMEQEETPGFVPKRLSKAQHSRKSRRRSIFEIVSETNGDEENLYSRTSEKKLFSLFLGEAVDEDNMKPISETKDPVMKRVSMGVKSMSTNRRASFVMSKDASMLSLFDPCGENRFSKDFVMNLQDTKEGKEVLASWGLLYCGGNIHIERDLKRVSKNYLLDLNTECFKW